MKFFMFLMGCCIFFVLMFAPATVVIGAGFSLGEAVNQGKVSMTIKGTGGSTGNVILITLKSLVSQTLHLTLTPGTVLPSVSGSGQDMVAAKIKGERINDIMYPSSWVITLRDDQEHVYLVEAYWLNFHNSNPAHSDQFRWGHIDARAQSILEAWRNQHANMNVLQSALWIDREHLSDFALRRRLSVNEEELAQARALLNSPSSHKNPPFFWLNHAGGSGYNCTVLFLLPPFLKIPLLVLSQILHEDENGFMGCQL